MSAEIDSVISSAMASLDTGGSDGGDSGDGGGADDLGTNTDAGSDVPAEGGTDAGTDAGAEAETADASGLPAEPVDDRSDADIAFDAELAELGLAAPKPGQRDNRIPYSRIRKIVANAKTKWSEKLQGEHTTALTERDGKITEYEARAQEFAQAEHLIETDPDRYIGILATLYPDRYKKFVAANGGADPVKDRAKADPEPQADIKYDDGSYGFSADQFARLREWDRREAARVAKEETAREMNERFGPIEKEYKATQQDHADQKRVRGDIGKLREQWGADIIDNQDVQKEIVAHMDANPKITLVAATRDVAMRRIQANRNAMRADLLKELKAAPKAAAKAPAAPNKSDSGGSESYEDIIRAAMRSTK